MKKLFLITLALMASCCLLADPSLEESVSAKEKLQTLFRLQFLEALDNDLLDLAISQVLVSTESELTLSQLKEKFKLSIYSSPETEHHFLSLYTSLFNENEVSEACSLLEDERYVKLRKKLSQVLWMCFQESKRMLKELAKSAQPVEKESVEKEIVKKPIVHVRKDNMQELLNASRPLIIDAYADWCGPCKYLALVMTELQREYGDVYQFAKLNAEKEKVLTKNLRITAFPTILFFKDGKEVGRHKGFMNKEVFLAKIEEFFQEVVVRPPR